MLLFSPGFRIAWRINRDFRLRFNSRKAFGDIPLGGIGFVAERSNYSPPEADTEGAGEIIAEFRCNSLARRDFQQFFAWWKNRPTTRRNSHAPIPQGSPDEIREFFRSPHGGNLW